MEYDLKLASKIETKLIGPLMEKHNERIATKLQEFCKSSKQKGIRNDLNYETLKSLEGILSNRERYHPTKVRDVLYTFLEKFTNSLYCRSSEMESVRMSGS